MKKGLLLCLIAFLFLSLPAVMKHFTCGFHLAKMRLNVPFRSDWEIEPLTGAEHEKLIQILSQPFSYLDRGAQCYVFESRDGQTVIKLFRYDAPQNPIRRFWRAHFRRPKKKTPPADKIEHLFTACLLAYTRAKEETALLYLHLNLTSTQLPFLAVRGPLGQLFRLPLDRYRFAIQRKARLFCDEFSRDPKTAPQKIDAFLSFLQNRAAKEIVNTDSNLQRNFGFLDGKVVEIDFGNYMKYPPDPLLQKKERERYTRRLRRWLHRHHPEWVAYLDQKLEES